VPPTDWLGPKVWQLSDKSVLSAFKQVNAVMAPGFCVIGLTESAYVNQSINQ